MKFSGFKKIYLVFALIVCGCAQNILTQLGSRSSDDALLEEAKKAVNAQEYQSAIDIISYKLSSSGQQRIDAKEILASGYAGKCGLNFIDFITSLTNAGAVSAFKMTTTPFVGRAVDAASCLTSLNTIESIGPNTSRTTDQNAFASVVGMSLMGSALRGTTDINPTNGDGAEDAANSSCNLTDAQVDLVILGFGFMSKNFAALSSAQIGSGSQGALTTAISKCTQIAGGNCEITDPANISNPLRLTMRDLLNTDLYGIGAYHVTADVSGDLSIPGACP